MPQDVETNYMEEITRLNAAARELVTITALLQGIFFAVVSLSDVRRLMQQWQLALFMIPLILWFLCLIFSMQAFVPREYKNDRTPEMLKKASDLKFLWLRLAYLMLLISLAFLMLDMALYFFVLPPPQTSCLPICGTPTVTPLP